MKLLARLTLIVMAMIMAACSNSGQAPRGGQPSDDKYTYEYVKKICVTQPNKALALLKTAEDKHKLPAFDVNMLRSMVYYNSMLDYKKAIHYAEVALADSEAKRDPDKLQNLLHMVSLEYYYEGNYAQCLDKASRALNEAYKNNNRRLVGQLMTTMGQCHSDVGNSASALYSFESAIEALDDECKKSPTWNNFYELATVHALKANTLLDTKQYTKLFDMRPEYETVLEKLNTLPEGISGINDQANATFYSIYAIGYEQSGQHEEGHDMFDKLSSTRASSTPEGATFVTPYLLLQKNYAEALKRSEEMEDVWRNSGRDSVDLDYSHNILMCKARALQGLGRYKEAMETGMRAYYLSDSLTQRLKKQNAMWMSEKLGKDFLKKQIDRQYRLLRTSHIAGFIITVLLVVCLFLMILAFRANMKLKIKNQATTALVNDLLTYKALFIKGIDKTRNAPKGKAAAEDAGNSEDPSGYQEFLRIEKEVVDRRLFVRPKLERADVANELGTSVANINTLFSTYCSQSFNNYINDLRMEYAAKLLKEKPEYTIEAIGAECGVPIRQTFHRLFSKKFGMTPAEYRKIATEKPVNDQSDAPQEE